jgi:UDP-3-O-[3-hydroxymyristoyl] glucosamine N-acyltransferase
MPDPRFYESLGPVSVGDLAALTGAELLDPALARRGIEGVAPLLRATASCIAFLADRRYRGDLAATAAGAVFVRADQADLAPAGCARLVTDEPLAAYCRAALALHRPRTHAAGVASVHPEAEIEDGVLIAPGAVVGAGARIGAGAEIGPNAVIGPGVAIGRRCRIHAGAVIGFALVGDEVSVYSGAVIGDPGFGVATRGGNAVDVPQLGRVILQDGVTIGANSCVDRGAWEDTVVGENTKIDNFVQIAHNVRIGRNCVLAAHIGLSGSVTVGDGVMFGGQVGVADHLEIGAGAKIAAGSGIMKNVPAGEVWCGTPARPIRRFMRETAWLMKNAAGPKDDVTDE